jgi:hypothetical protein
MGTGRLGALDASVGIIDNRKCNQLGADMFDVLLFGLI